MIICPLCSAENIDGSDVCEECHQPLDDMHLPTPATEVERCLLRDRVKVLEPKDPISVTSSESIRSVLKLMVDKGIGCVLVEDNGKLVGIFSERDAVMKFDPDDPDALDQPVTQWMTSEAQCLDADAKVAFAVQRMDLGSFRHVPIVEEDGRAVGIISVRDILRYLTEKMTSS